MNTKQKYWYCTNLFSLFRYLLSLCPVLIGGLFFVSCSSLFKPKLAIPKDLSTYKEGVFSGLFTGHKKTLNQKGQIYRFSGDIFVSATTLRMDLSLPLLGPLLSLLLKEQEFTALFFKKKKFYKGPISKARILDDTLPTQEVLGLLAGVLFDRLPPSAKNWTCEHDKQSGLLIKCLSPKWQVYWQREGGFTKDLLATDLKDLQIPVVKSAKALLLKSSQWSFYFQYLSFSPNVDPGAFNLNVPKNFNSVFILK